MDDFFTNLDLDAICSVDPLSELEPEPTLVAEDAKLESAKNVVTTVKNQPVSLIPNLPEIVKVMDLLINSLIPEDQK